MGAIIMRLVYASAWAILVYVLCMFFGGLLALIAVPPVQFVGSFLKETAALLSIVAFLFALASGMTFTIPVFRSRPPAS